MSNKARYEALAKLEDSKGKLAYTMHVFGDHLAAREGYKSIDGIEAVHFYLVNKFMWSPATVKAMSDDDLRFCLTEEMHGWVMPEEARRGASFKL
ncbi:hypothetical protein [Phaeobacter inhibens]|uniref:hypothetical protein n=1 Tax=Phaeobacter inhibens TaxID=221822 RepID=UPI0024927D59|nr:hypothetical protein [Phaeobacter inhibens]